MAASKLSANASTRLVSELRARARGAGLLDRYPARYARRALLLTAPLVISLYLAWTHSSSSVVILMSVATAFVCIQLGLIAHDAGHGAVARASSANAFAGHLAFTVLNGVGFQSWCAGFNGAASSSSPSATGAITATSAASSA